MSQEKMDGPATIRRVVNIVKAQIYNDLIDYLDVEGALEVPDEDGRALHAVIENIIRANIMKKTKER